MDLLEVVEKARCVGCEACVNACPRACISMKEDTEGFLYPMLDARACIECGRCRQVCPALHIPPAQTKPLLAYAGYHRQHSIRMQSTSGAVFPLLAEQVLEQGGVVFGAAFDKRFQVCHQAAETVEQAKKFQRSKYVQSRVGSSYRQARQALDAGRKVLFTGTPCQTAGLLAFLGGGHENLLCQDMVCHSVPSPGVWRDYLMQRESACGAEAVQVDFRSKAKEGWERYHFRIRYSNGTEESWTPAQSPYLRAFLSGLISRPACHSCPFKGTVRASDITLADFWGVEQVCPEAYCADGTSLILVHTEKGAQALRQLAEEIRLWPVAPEAAVAANPAACAAIPEARRRAQFWREYPAGSLEELVLRCLKPSLRERMSKGLRKSLPARVLRRIKRIIG